MYKRQLRDGIEDGIWYKIGKVNCNFEKEMEVPIFGTCQSSIYNNGNIIYVDPNTNWYLWKINQKSIRVGTLPEIYRDVVEPGPVFSYIEIVNRIKYGYYRWNSSNYNSLRRRPHVDTDSFVKREFDDSIEYLHFLGDNVVQRILIPSRGNPIVEEGNPLSFPQFWETNWDIDEFITPDEFKSAWDKYALNQ